MNRREIDRMMQDLPSQRQESIAQKVMICLVMMAVLLVLCLL
jgi:hypothetical protein